jgi:two-component system, NarL family, sensor histidine kinase UhpB
VWDRIWNKPTGLSADGYFRSAGDDPRAPRSSWVALRHRIGGVATTRNAGARRLIASITLAAAIPVLLFAGWRSYVTAGRDQAEAQRTVVAIARRVAEQVTAELAKELEITEALAAAIDLRPPNLMNFYDAAQRLASARPLWETVSLATPDGKQILNILRPLNEPLGPIPDRESFEEAVRTRKAVIGGIGPVGQLSGKRLVSLHVPVSREGELRYVITVGLVPSGISAVLRTAGAPPDWIGAIVDADGKVVARTIAEEAELGRQVLPIVLDALRHGPEGFYRGRTFEGVEVETVYRKLVRPVGWSVHFGIPADALSAPVSRAMIALFAGALAALSLGGGLAWLVGRDFAQRRAEEATRAALALSVSEERGAVAVEAAELGMWRWDAGRAEVIGSERLRDLLDLPRTDAEAPEFVWPADRFLAALAAEDRTSVKSALRKCLDDNEPIDLEVRAVRRNGTTRWVRLIGRRPSSDDPTSAVIHGVISDVEPRKRAETERLRLLQRLSEAQENEQRRIARELHDQVGQTVTGLSLGLKGLEKALDSGAPLDGPRQQVQWLRELANEIGRDIHRAASDLRPTAIDDLGLSKALTAYTEEWTKISGIPVDLQVIGQVRPLPLSIETAVYRVVQEALTNVVKHAAAQSVSIVLEFREMLLRLVVEDDGVGMDLDRTGHQNVELIGENGRVCLGITGMRERLAVLGGSLTIEAAPGVGTTLFIQVPVPAAGQ